MTVTDHIVIWISELNGSESIETPQIRIDLSTYSGTAGHSNGPGSTVAEADDHIDLGSNLLLGLERGQKRPKRLVVPRGFQNAKMRLFEVDPFDQFLKPRHVHSVVGAVVRVICALDLVQH